MLRSPKMRNQGVFEEGPGVVEDGPGVAASFCKCKVFVSCKYDFM